MNVKQEINPKAFIFTLPHSFLLLPYFLKPQKIDLKTAIRVTKLVQEVGRQLEDEYSFLKSSRCFQHTYGLFLMFKLILQNLKVY